MQKVFLPARPANEGARRLAWWLLDDHSAALRGLRRARLRGAGVGDVELNRLLAGELVPGGGAGWAISRATRGAVRVGDWWNQPEGAWAERPVDHLSDRKAA